MKFPWMNSSVASTPAPDNIFDTVVKALERIGAAPAQRETSSDGEKMLLVGYGDGHFVVQHIATTAFVFITMPNVLVTDESDINEVRFCCNQFNSRNAIINAHFNARDDSPKLGVHLTSYVAVGSVSQAARDLSASLIALCHDARMINGFFARLIERRGETLPFDFELDELQNRRKIEIVRAAEFSDAVRRDVAFEPEYGTNLSLLSLLGAVTGVDAASLPVVSVASMGYDGFFRSWGSSDAASSDLCADLFSDGVGADPTRKWVMIRVELDDMGPSIHDIRQVREITVALALVSLTPKNALVRATVTIGGNHGDFDTSLTCETSGSRAIDTMLSVCRTSEASAMSEYRYMLDDARDKFSAGRTDELTAEQDLLIRSFVSHSGYSIYHGTRHFVEKRFVQALLLLSTAFSDMSRHFNKMDEGARKAFFEVCSMIGSCYIHFGRNDLAFYYLSLGLNTGNYRNDRSYVSCLVNAGDPRAREVVESTMSDMRSTMEQEQEKGKSPDDMMIETYGFLNRCYARLLVDQGDLDQAEKILHEMLANDENDRFAINELARIRRIRSGE